MFETFGKQLAGALIGFAMLVTPAAAQVHKQMPYGKEELQRERSGYDPDEYWSRYWRWYDRARERYELPDRERVPPPARPVPRNGRFREHPDYHDYYLREGAYRYPTYSYPSRGIPLRSPRAWR